MTIESLKQESTSQQKPAANYDPFVRGGYPVGVRTVQARDPVRNRPFSCEIWYPAAAQHAGQDLAPESQDTFLVPLLDTQRRQMAVRDAAPHPGTYPLVIFSHHSGGHRRSATFLCTHLSSHGYAVAALDHSEVVAPELARKEGETADQRASRWEAVIANRVPDARFLIDLLLSATALDLGIRLDPARLGIVGHSFGAWTALATPDGEPRIRAVVALAPGGTSNPRPGILPVKLDFRWGRDVPVLYLVAENDVCLALKGMYETFERTPASKLMVILRRADHMHFMDHVEEMHERVRKMPVPPELAYLAQEMRPIEELCSGELANLFVRGLTLCHMDATLQSREDARQFLSGDIKGQLAARGVEVMVKSGLGN